jgi:hypothetical protein
MCGTVSIAGRPMMRLTEVRMQELGPLLLAAAAELSETRIGASALARARVSS